MTAVPSIELLVGLASEHWVEVQDIAVHREIAEPIEALVAAAAAQGIELALASGFRSFARQLAIWNAKATGERAVLDDQGRPLDLARLSPKERMFAILRWSALPGTSRHHWGTDVDVWDRAAVDASYRLQLVPEEYGPQGPFARLGTWLARSPEFSASGFYRPYQNDRGGVAPEPWHLSYRPLGAYYARHLTPARLAPVLERAAQLGGEELALCDTVLQHLDDIFTRFVAR